MTFILFLSFLLTVRKVLTLNARRKGSINQLYLMRDKRQTVKPDKRAALKSQRRLMELLKYMKDIQLKTQYKIKSFAIKN